MAETLWKENKQRKIHGNEQTKRISQSKRKRNTVESALSLYRVETVERETRKVQKQRHIFPFRRRVKVAIGPFSRKFLFCIRKYKYQNGCCFPLFSFICDIIYSCRTSLYNALQSSFVMHATQAWALGYRIRHMPKSAMHTPMAMETSHWTSILNQIYLILFFCIRKIASITHFIGMHRINSGG